MSWLTSSVAAPARAFAATFRNRNLRRLQFAWVGSIIGSWSYVIALAIYVYARDGATAVAVLAAVRMISVAIVSPFAATLADRHSRRVVMVASDLARASAMSVAAVAIGSGWSQWLVYVLVVVSSLVGTPFRPAQAALLPQLATTPGELTAANVASSTLESVGMIAGPALGALVLAATNTETVFALNAAMLVWSAALVVGIRPVAHAETPTASTSQAGAPVEAAGGIFGGFRAIGRDRAVLGLVSVYTAQTFIAGAFGVLLVVTALKLLEGGSSEIGVLNAAFGVGGLVGGFIAIVLAERGRLVDDFALGVVLYGAPLVLVGVAPHLAAAAVAFAIAGIGNSLVDIAAVTLLQRGVPDEVLGRVFGVLEGLLIGSMGLGALAAPVLLHILGTRGALVACGALLPILAVAFWPGLRRLDGSASPLVSLLRGVEILAPLALPVLEQLAGSLAEVHLPAGATVIRVGEPGDRFYVIAEGEVEIEGNTFGPGASFGEIALLRDVPRTATVVASTSVLLYALERDEFLAAVTGNEPSSAVAETVVARRLGELRSDPAAGQG
jgi:MFS family permease